MILVAWRVWIYGYVGNGFYEYLCMKKSQSESCRVCEEIVVGGGGGEAVALHLE
jgi:hypothetical protein